ncbi:hypothetical protein [Vibrio sp. B1FLJ16]|uniref:hypothetical protein n=1 Tax=Vibrio sp. B1FLJ16 TaxID=2751178 RepID=UPI0015F42259|nr:hypothetical protein [Vibrio sp. B1FLJ16]CAD7821203.1 hypothetical protein ACOMICROBIO_EPCKBFOG_04016 [Vibrio sp. B1FLJ16]CAE6945589.1 hypothetical protein ACOMICROBIO_EPCKBFOG_04016 [Vibrio sp. B1FLJ16]
MTKIKNIILINMLLGATSVAHAANDKLPNGKPFVLLSEQISEVNEQVSEVNGQVSEVENKLQALEDKYDAIIAEINTSIEGLEGKISVINLKITDLEEKDAQLEEEIAQTISDLESQGTDIATLVEEYKALKAQLEALEASAVTSSELVALEAEIETVKGSITAVSTEVAGLLLDIEDNAALIALLQRDMKNLTVAMENAIPQGECPQGQFLNAINEDGSIVCSGSDNSGANSTITTLISSPVEVSKNTVVPVDLACGTNQQVISGGFSIKDSQEGFNVVQSLPWNNGWRVMIKTDGNWKGGSLSVHAICMSN